MKITHTFTLFALLILLCSWGEEGHQKINGSTSQFFPARLNNYKEWTEKLSEHGSDPDNRRRTDPTEGIKHYIDIDAYQDFIETHKIVEGEEEAFNKYGKAFIMKNGTFPWVTDSTYRVLVKQLKAKDLKLSEKQRKLPIGLVQLVYTADDFRPSHRNFGGLDRQRSDLTF